MKKIVFYGILIAFLISGLSKSIIQGEAHTLIGRFINQLEHLTADAFYQTPRQVSEEIYVIGIDENSLNEIGPWQTWSRDIMGQLIGKLNEDPKNKPAAIGIDIMYFGESKQDDYLVEQVEAAGNIVMASQVLFKQKIVEKDNRVYVDNLDIDRVEYPFKALKEVSKQGHINVINDQDGVVRNSLQSIPYNESYIHSFAYEVYKQYCEHHQLEDTIKDTLQKKQIWHIPYAAQVGEYYNELSFTDVLKGKVPTEIFRDKIVLIGPYAAGMLDRYHTPISQQGGMDGVEIHANIIQSFLDENFKIQVLPIIQQGLIAGVLFIGYFVLRVCKFWKATLTVVMLNIVWIIGCKIAYEQGYIMVVTYVPLTLMGIYVWQLINRYYNEYKRRKQVTQTFKQYIAPQIVEQISKDKTFKPYLGGQRKDIAVFFVDIRGFTTVSEQLEPEKIVEILNIYLEVITTSIYTFGGTLDKFIGDAAMAVFNAPFEQEDYVYQAVQTAQEIINRVKAKEAFIREEYGITLACGIGIHCGEAIVGNIGTAFRMDYTAIGDVVNTAARLEGQAQAGEIVLSEAVCERLKGRIAIHYVGTKLLKGKEQETKLYTLEQIL